MKENSMEKYQMDKVIKSTIARRIMNLRVVYVIYFKNRQVFLLRRDCV